LWDECCIAEEHCIDECSGIEEPEASERDKNEDENEDENEEENEDEDENYV
jgi:hypothetical protein